MMSCLVVKETPTQRGLAVLRRLDSVSLGGRAARVESLLGIQ